MKLQHLALGERFEFEGQVFAKTGPLTASPEAGGGQRLIPRHAELKPLDRPGSAPAKGTSPDNEKRRWLKCVADYHERARELLTQADSARLNELQAAYRRLLDKLG